MVCAVRRAFKLLRVMEAWAALRFTVVNVVPSMKKVTVPVGVPVAGDTGLTVAVNVTDWPKTELAMEGVTATDVLLLLTVTGVVSEPLPGV